MNRRTMFAAAPALALAVVPPPATAHPDAALLEACRLFPAAVAAVNDPTTGNLEDDHPAWVEYSRLCKFIGDTDALTMEGWLAKARAAKVEALSINGEEAPHGTCAEEWAWDLMNDMLCLRAGGAA